jgi:ribonuclease HII
MTPAPGPDPSARRAAGDAAKKAAPKRLVSKQTAARRAAAKKAAAKEAAVRQRARKLAAKKLALKKLTAVPPSLREERLLLRSGHTLLAAIDEVGRGALAGPVTVGVVVVDLDTGSAPTGVRDSKLLTPQARVKLAPKLRRWAPAHAVGHASSDEIDRIGIIAALRLAACRALARLEVRPDCVLLDGSHNWLSIPAPRPPAAEQDADETMALFEMAVSEPGPEPEPDPTAAEIRAELVPPRVVTQIKADMRCAAVAAASVLAKVERDAIMVELAEKYPDYGWHENKGYSAPEHKAALRRLGPCELHRTSWNLLSGAFKESDEDLSEDLGDDLGEDLDDALDDDPGEGGEADELDGVELEELIELSPAEEGAGVPVESSGRPER